MHGVSVRAPLLLLALSTLVRANVHFLDTDEHFEYSVLHGDDCWAVLMVEGEVDLTKPYVNVFVGMEKDSHPHVKFGIASINITKTHAAEFNVGRSRVPRILLFKSTSREAEHIALPKGDEFPTGKELNVLLTGEFVDNPTDHYDNCKKQQLHGDEL